MTSRISPIFFFNDTATTEIYTLSLHDALPICLALDGARHLAAERRHDRCVADNRCHRASCSRTADRRETPASDFARARSEEHTSELQSLTNLVCRLLLEKKKNTQLMHNGDTHH